MKPTRKPSGRMYGGERPPELLYHSIDARIFSQLIQGDVFAYPNGRSIFASKILGYAWQVAHRNCEHPFVAVIDASIARHHNVTLRKNKRNLWEINQLPIQCILNAHPEFGEQISAGGIPYVIEEGVYKIALIQMKRMYFNSWEIAKGKLELGEHPLQAAKREIFEEMGADFELSEPHSLGTAQFSIMTGSKRPMLKSIHVYAFRASKKSTTFNVAADEGIIDVQWFDVETALRLVSYRSLGHIMQNLKRHLLDKGEASLGTLPSEGPLTKEEWKPREGRTLPSSSEEE